MQRTQIDVKLRSDQNFDTRCLAASLSQCQSATLHIGSVHIECVVVVRLIKMHKASLKKMVLCETRARGEK